MKFKIDPSAYPKKPPLESYQQMGTFRVLYQNNDKKSIK